VGSDEAPEQPMRLLITKPTNLSVIVEEPRTPVFKRRHAPSVREMQAYHDALKKAFQTTAQRFKKGKKI
jgi:hypothetical protein